MRRIYGEPRELSADELARHDAVKAEYDKLDAEYAEAEDYDGEVEDRLEKLGAELDTLNDRPTVYEPEKSPAPVSSSRSGPTENCGSSVASSGPRTSR